MNAHHDNAPLYRRFAELLHRTMGLDAASLGHHAIERAVDQRAAAWRAQRPAAATLADYWDAMQASPAMVQALIETVVVPETWFYRDADAFHALARLAHERLHERAAGLPLRILSLPCSTGEEPYTIAMSLLDDGIDAARFRIDAMDISERSLALAQRALYGRNSFRGNAFAFRDAHFTRTEDGWRLAPRIVDTVRFSCANLMQIDAAALGVYDFVFCRNVLIYFDRETQQTALHALDSLLAENGTLFVGPAETGLPMRHGMQSAKIPLAFAFRRAAPADAPWHGRHTAPLAGALAMTHSPVPALAPALAFAAEPFAWTDPVAGAALDEVTRSASLDGAARPNLFYNGSARHAGTPPIPVTPALNSQPPQTNASPPHAPTTAARDTLRAAHALADAGRLTEAAAAINAYLEQHAPHADAFYLLGVLADASGDTHLARGQYRKALYLEPQHAEALAHLAALLELEGDRDGARRLMQRATRAQGAPRG
ncbi:chemotaxis protein methyltransferase WspC [Paraburkholderia sp. RAU2J]|uniref:CheR family methyltransferase n=1 Tax=Paraburkholderia sp. RAU2J TaxID=1938810 RepID=UPI000EAD4850|nr:protein-glutamate O-methyltransferase CheR [Paraburkholderia sp. RAU2J]RKT25592.1 chemotaxis protein methyltransferase WspC [Paraburkholderia sp. RAU2J]